MKLKKKRIRNPAKAKMKSIEKAIKIGMDNLYSNVSYLLQELELKNDASSEYVILKSKDDILEEMDKLKKDIIFLSKGVNINFIIPILLKALDKIYFDDNWKHLKDKGIALKNLIAIIWSEGDKTILSNTCVLERSFFVLLKKMIKYSKLVHYQWLFSGEKNDLQIVLYLSEMEVELDETSRKFLQNNYIFPEVTYGDGQRSTGINNNLFFDDPGKYIDSINKIFDGAEPNNIDYFKGTFFEHFKGVDDTRYTNFWKGFKIRLNLFTNSFVQQQNNGGIFYLSMSEFERITSQYTYDSNFKNNLMLTRDFIDIDYLGNPNKIVSRPLIPLFNEKYCFISCYNMFDSLNNYIESFIFKMNTTGTIPEKDEELFQIIYSKPFEIEVIKLLCNSGYQSGSVTNSGAWQIYTETGLVTKEIANDDFRNQNTGEIDCLAISEAKRIIYVIECKVLQLPSDFLSYRNRITHLHGKYREQLQKKVDFVKSKYKDYSIRPILLLDKGFTTIRQYPNNSDNLRILTLNLLKEEL